MFSSKSLEMPPAALKKLVTEYLPQELLPQDWSCKNQNVLKNLRNLMSSGSLKTFEDEEDLSQNLKVFKAFPRCFSKIGVSVKEQYTNELISYQNMKKQEFIYKSDMFPKLYKLVVAMDFKDLEVKKFLVNAIPFYLRSQEIHYHLNAEMIEFPEEKVEVLGKNLARGFLPAFGSLSDFPDEDVYYRFDDSIMCNSSNSEEFRQVLKASFKAIPFGANKIFYTRCLYCIEEFVKQIEGFIEENPNIFMPRSSSNGKAIVRLFTDKPSNFVMVRELYKALKDQNLNASAIKKEMYLMPKLATWSFQEVCRKLDKATRDKIEFVRIPIMTSQFQATPIPAIEGGYCILATDALMDLLTDMIHVKKVFQIIRPDQMDLMKQFFDSLTQKYFYESDSIIFLDLQEIEFLKAEWNTFFYRNFKNQMKDAKEIRNVRITGYTSKDLMKELKYLNLFQDFPGLQKYEFTGPNNAKIGTWRMYSTIKNFVILQILSTFPKLMFFIHQQEGCKRLCHQKCLICLKGPQAVVKRAAEAVVVGPEISEANVVEKYEKASEVEPETQCQSNQEHDPISANAEVSEEAKPKKKKNKPAKLSEMVSEPPKESQACPKCIRASEFTRKTNEKLRLSKVEVKALKKELTGIQKVNEEKDVRIRLLERKLLEQETRLKEQELELIGKDAKIEELKITSFEKTKEIEKQEERINSLKDKIYEQEGLISRMKNHYLKSTPIRSPEESRKFNVHLLKLLDIQKTLESENPIKKVEEFTSTLAESSKNQEVKYLAKSEMNIYQSQCNSYIKVLEGNIKLVQGNQHITLDQIPDLLDFPQFSQEFRDAFKKTMKKVAPVICRSLLKNPPEEPECSICLEVMNYGDETNYCGTCRWIYHKGCMSEWLKEKKTCPSCRSLNDEEFPRLS